MAAELQAGEIPLVGRTEAEVSADIGRRLLAEGHHQVNFAIVAAGANAAQPHHEAGGRVIEAGEVVLCDFGGTMHGADGVATAPTSPAASGPAASRRPSSPSSTPCSTTPSGPRCAAAVVGTPCEDVDARRPRASSPRPAGASCFIHRTGHGIGIEEHEDPYIVAGNRDAARRRATPSPSSPASTSPGRWGARLEDIVVATDDGPDALNQADHAPRRRRRLSRSTAVIDLDAATVLLQWATGGLLFLWVTTRRREVGLGYGWLLRGIYGLMAAGAVVRRRRS